MAFAATSKTSIAYVAETTIGTTPATPAFALLRRTSGNLDAKKSTVVSDEIQSDRNVRDELLVGVDVNGSYDFELSYASFDDIMAAALMGAWATNVLKNGVTAQSFTFEEKADIGGSYTYNRFAGCMVEGLSLNISTRSIIKGSFEVMGMTPSAATSAISGATYSNPNTNVIETGVNVASLTVSGITPAPKIRSVSLSVKNNLRTRPIVGSLYSQEPGLGVIDVIGTIEAYFETLDLYNAALSHGTADLAFTIGSVTNKKYTFTLPGVRLLQGDRRLGGKSDDIMLSVPFRAKYDATSGASLTITRAVA